MRYIYVYICISFSSGRVAELFLEHKSRARGLSAERKRAAEFVSLGAKISAADGGGRRKGLRLPSVISATLSSLFGHLSRDERSSFPYVAPKDLINQEEAPLSIERE